MLSSLHGGKTSQAHELVRTSHKSPCVARASSHRSMERRSSLRACTSECVGLVPAVASSQESMDPVAASQASAHVGRRCHHSVGERACSTSRCHTAESARTCATATTSRTGKHHRSPAREGGRRRRTSACEHSHLQALRGRCFDQ